MRPHDAFLPFVWLALTAGCAALGPGKPEPITKIVDGQVITTRAVSPRAYEHVTRGLLYEEQGRLEDAALELARALPYDGEAPEIHARLAEILIDLDRLAEAQDHVAASLAIEPTVQGWLADGHLRQARHDQEGAVEAFRRATHLSVDAGPTLAEEAHLDLAEALLGRLDLEGAHETLRSLVRVAAGTRLGRLNLAAVSWALGRALDAEGALRQVLAEEPADTDALVMLGQLLAATDRSHEAKATFRDALNRSESPIEIAGGLVHWLAARGDTAEAIAVAEDVGGGDEGAEGPAARATLERAAGRPDRARAIATEAVKRGHDIGRMTVLAGQAAEDQGRDDEAVTLYLQLAGDVPEFVEARTRAAAVLRRGKKLTRARQILEEAASGRDANRGSAAAGDGSAATAVPEEIVAGLALIDEGQGQVEDAIKRLDTAERERGGNGRLALVRAGIEERRGDWRGAIAIAESLLADDPLNAAAMNFAGFVAADHLDAGPDLDLALRRVRTALALEPGSAGILDSVGWAFFKKGDLARAAEHLEQAERLEPEDAEILAHLGDLYARRGDRDRAVTAYRRGLALVPEDALRKRLEDRVRKMEAGDPATGNPAVRGPATRDPTVRRPATRAPGARKP